MTFAFLHLSQNSREAETGEQRGKKPYLLSCPVKMTEFDPCVYIS